jgi:hypothetical protein
MFGVDYFSNITTVYFGNSKKTNDLTTLATLKDLRRLQLPDSQFRDELEQVGKLQQSLPNCSIYLMSDK